MKPYDLRTFTGPRGLLIAYMGEAITRWLHGDPTPYIWGGASLETGIDCSGFVILGLQRAGLRGIRFDDTAQGLFHVSPYVSSNDALPGDLVFFGSSATHISHVGMLYNRIGSGWAMVEAGGGGSGCITPEIAFRHNAYVRPQAVDHRKDCRGYGRVL